MPSAIPFSGIFSPDGAYAYVACLVNPFDNPTLGILQLNTLTLAQKQLPFIWGLGTLNGFMVISPSGNNLYLGTGIPINSGLGTIEVYNISKGKFETPISVAGNFPGAITPNGKYLYCPDRASNNVYVVNTATGQLSGTPISIPTGVGQMVVAPNGKYGYVLSGNNVAVITVAGRIK